MEAHVLDEKIQRVKALIEQREKIDIELAELLNVKLKRPRPQLPPPRREETGESEAGQA